MNKTVLAMLALILAVAPVQAQAIAPDEARAIAKDVYIYGSTRR
jgi:hypothetical protein